VILAVVQAPEVVLKPVTDLKLFKTSLENICIKHNATKQGQQILLLPGANIYIKSFLPVTSGDSCPRCFGSTLVDLMSYPCCTFLDTLSNLGLYKIVLRVFESNPNNMAS
jgi:hypothetical protein